MGTHKNMHAILHRCREEETFLQWIVISDEIWVHPVNPQANV